MSHTHPVTGCCERCKVVRHSNTVEGIEYIRQLGERMKPRSQWAFKPGDGDIVGKSATRAERKALRKRYLQERPHDGKLDKFPK